LNALRKPRFNPLTFLDQSKWVDMHEFLKGNFIKLEAFWAEFGIVFKNLV